MSDEKKKVYTGVEVIKDFDKIDELYKKGELKLSTFKGYELYPNQCLVIKSGKQSALAMVKKDKVILLPQTQKLSTIIPRNKEQNFVMSLLSDPTIDLITLSGIAGSGKTLLALAYAMEELNAGRRNKIVLCKSLSPVGREIGYLKGTYMDKIRPWLGAFYDNFEILGVPQYELDNMTSENPDPIFQKENPSKRIELSPITFIQGRSISNAIIIIDEAQNLSQDVVKQILSRPAENSKIIMLGDLAQVFEKGVTSENNGLLAAIEAGKNCEFIGHIHLLKCERSRLAEWAWENL
jgi:PhoH-like ATPase